LATWNLTYKGVEILHPEDWNKVVDALNDLDKRSPLELKGGLGVWSGDGATTTFKITHGMTATPTTVLVTPASLDARRPYYAEADGTEITIEFETAPPSGTDNVKLYWLAVRL